MAKHVGVQLPEDLHEVLKAERSVAVLATFSERGLPHTTPVHWLYPKERDSILMTVHKEHEGYHNMAWQKKVTLCFLEGGNIAYSIMCRAGVVRAPSLVHPLMNIVRLDIVDVLSDRSPLFAINAGVKWSYVSPEAEEIGRALMGELKELAQTL